MPIEKRKKIIEALQRSLNMLDTAHEFALGAPHQSGHELTHTRAYLDTNITEVKVNGHMVTVEYQGEIDPHLTMKPQT